MGSVLATRLQPIDLAITESAARLLGHNPIFDSLTKYLIHMDTFKIFPIVALLCAAASRQTSRSAAVRVLLNGIAAGLLALVVTRFVQNLGPARPRPAFLPAFNAPLPFFDMATPDWSSFPSDTTALGVALALVVLRSSRLLGIFALIWAALISLARLVGAFHYPSDLLAGAVIGALSVFAMTNSLVAKVEVRLIDRVLVSAPTLACLLLVGMLFQISTMFDDVRHGAGGLLKDAGILKERPPAQASAIRSARSPSEDN